MAGATSRGLHLQYLRGLLSTVHASREREKQPVHPATYTLLEPVSPSTTARPREVATVVGIPKRCSSIEGSCFEQALRASRAVHDSRQCAR
jgi:hypothetical protein